MLLFNIFDITINSLIQTSFSAYEFDRSKMDQVEKKSMTFKECVMQFQVCRFCFLTII